MLKKLKRKFVLINICLVGIVIFAVFFVVCINTYRQAETEVKIALSMALENSQRMNEEPKEPFEIGVDKDDSGPGEPKDKEGRGPYDKRSIEAKPLNYTAVVVSVDEDGKISPQGEKNASMSETVMQKAAKEVMSSDKESGKLNDMELFYKKDSDSSETMIAFADSSYFDETIRNTLTIYTLMFAGGMAALLLISILLAKVAVAPVKAAWDRQRRFVADASHELKTPLTVILANNEIIMEDADDKMKRWVESTHEEASHMKKLVDDLLFLARMDEAETIGGQVLSSEENLSDIVTGAILQLEPVVFEAGAVIEADIEEGIYIHCDPTKIRQLLHILLDNAVKYCEGEKEIFVKLEKSSQKTVLKVINTSAEIEPEKLKHIFDRFYRSDEARNSEGYGLGLCIAESIAEQHRGKIKASSGRLKQIETAEGMMFKGENVTGTELTVIFE